MATTISVYKPVDERDGAVKQVVQPERCGCCRRCYSPGCVWTVIGIFYFFVIFPAGVLLIIHGNTKGVVWTIVLGVVVLVVFACAAPGAYMAIRYCRTERRLRLQLDSRRAGGGSLHRAHSTDRKSLVPTQSTDRKELVSASNVVVAGEKAMHVIDMNDT